MGKLAMVFIAVTLETVEQPSLYGELKPKRPTIVHASFSRQWDIVTRWTYDSLGEPITIGIVTISSGDYIDDREA